MDVIQGFKKRPKAIPDEERRRSKRYRVRKGLYARVANDVQKVGGILDIGTQGMAFKYIRWDRKQKPLIGFVELEIFDREENLHLKGIPLRVAYDIPLKGPNSIVGAFIRRLGGRFGRMTLSQRAQVSRLIGEFRL